jgi:hypothetical protein
MLNRRWFTQIKPSYSTEWNDLSQNLNVTFSLILFWVVSKLLKVALNTIKPTNQPCCYSRIFLSYTQYTNVLKIRYRYLIERRKPPTCGKSLTNFITYCYIKYTSPWSRFELATSVMIGTDCIGSCLFGWWCLTPLWIFLSYTQYTNVLKIRYRYLIEFENIH